MKTKRLYTAFTIILAVVFAVSLKASSTFAVSIATNPPVTEMTCDETNVKALMEFFFEEEAYIDDIPFNTECVSKNCLYQKAMSVVFELDEEMYVEDIPFNTELVKEQHSLQTNNHNFSFEDEDYIDDIPFDTYTLANKYNRNQLVHNR